MPVTTIQQTGKVWKFSIMIGALATIAGVITLIVALSSPSKSGGFDARFAWSIIEIVGGVFLFCIGRVGAWWFHG